jgi:hypothetical protein
MAIIVVVGARPIMSVLSTAIKDFAATISKSIR